MTCFVLLHLFIVDYNLDAMASNTLSSQEIEDKRNLVKQNSAALAKILIALDLELFNFQNKDRISKLEKRLSVNMNDWNPTFQILANILTKMISLK